MSYEVTGPPSAAREEFVELICQDDDLVRAEFDALIAATWQTPPASPPPAPPRRPPPAAEHPAAPVPDTGRSPTGREPARRRGGRQRGPP